MRAVFDGGLGATGENRGIDADQAEAIGREGMQLSFFAGFALGGGDRVFSGNHATTDDPPRSPGVGGALGQQDLPLIGKDQINAGEHQVIEGLAVNGVREAIAVAAGRLAARFFEVGNR